MVRKQIYLEARQEALIKRLARTRGVSEAEIIRQAIEWAAGAAPQTGPGNPAAWERARRFMLSLRGRGRGSGGRRWKREDAYEKRLNRHARRSG